MRIDAMSDSNSPKVEPDSPNLLKDLRKFRFQKKALKKMSTSDEDTCNSDGFLPVRRKIVNRIEDSDSDAGSPTKSPRSDSGQNSELKKREQKLKYIREKFATFEIVHLQEVLAEANWDTDVAEKILNESRKRSRGESHKAKLKKRKKKKYDEEGDVDSDEAVYRNKVFDSDAESDAEISNDLVGDKKAVLDFMETALPAELLLIHQCSQKKVEAIVNARPYKSWRDLVKKFQEIKYLDTELLNSAQVLLQTRNVVESLMKKCLRLSANMEKAIAAGSTAIKNQPAGISEGLKLASYQMLGLNWLNILHTQNVNGILADEMGLGKTVQVIAFLTYLKENDIDNEMDGPHLIVVPSSTMNNWSQELERWSPGLNVVKYYGQQDERKEMRMGWRNGDLDDVDVLLTTYNLISSTPEERRLFRVMPLKYVIFDEAHMLKNMGTIRYENLFKINAKRRILLTGTPLQNNLLELMSLLIFVMPSLFAGKQNDLKSLFSKNPKLTANKPDSKPKFEEEQVNNAKQIMKPFVLRRLKSEVLKDLPTKTDKVVYCALHEKQQLMYKKLIAEFSAEADQNREVNGIGMMMQLRKLANHPLLVRNYYDEEKLQLISKRLAREPAHKQKNPDYVFEDLLWMSDYQINQLSRTFKSIAGFGLPLELIPQSGKLKHLDEILPDLKACNHRVLIFSQFTMVLDIVEEYLTIRNHRYLRMDGQTPVMERQDLIDEFTQDSDIFVFLLSTRAGGLGINLTAADTVIIHDIDFNPYNDKQAEDRCHRVGQTKPVSIIRLLSKDTIEEGMYDIAKEKLNLEQKITGNEEENENTDKKGVLKLLKQILGIEAQAKHIVLSESPNKSPNGFANDDIDEL